MSQPPTEDYKYSKFIENFHCSVLERKFGIALFGAGRAGMFHFENLVKNIRVELLYVVEASEERLKQLKLATQLKTTRFVNLSAIDKVLSDQRVDGVIITTPTQTHCELVIKSLQMGKAVFCEKPLASDLKDVKKCYEMAKKWDLPLFCAFNRRFDPSFASVRERVKRGELGKIRIIKTTSRDSPPPSIEYLKVSGGIFFDSAVHDIDLICWILGGEYPTTVYATATAHSNEIAEIGAHDTVLINLTFPSGAMGCIDMSRYCKYGYDQRIECFGSNGMIQCGNQKPITVDTFTSTGVTEAPIFYSFPSRYKDAYEKEMDHFLNTIQGIESPLVHGIETLSVSQVAAACDESVRTGLPVKISYDFDLYHCNGFSNGFH